VTPPRDSGRAEWEGLAPWDKAAQWREAAPDIADEVIALARKYAEKQLLLEQERLKHDFEMDARRQAHLERMESRGWWLELFAVALAFLSLVGSLAVSWRFASQGHVYPGLGVLGAGSAISAGTYLAGRHSKKRRGKRKSDSVFGR
jgi:hypothetical protein